MNLKQLLEEFIVVGQKKSFYKDWVEGLSLVIFESQSLTVRGYPFKMILEITIRSVSDLVFLSFLT